MDSQLAEKRRALLQKMRSINEAESHRFEQGIGIKKLEIHFDYDLNVLTLRGDWRSSIGTIKMDLPFRVPRNKTKIFEEWINLGFEVLFLV